MKKLICVIRLLPILVFMALSGQALADQLQINDPTDGWLNMRSGPGTEFAILRQLDNGVLVDELDQDGNWSFVRTPSGATGWVYRPYTQPARRVQLGDVDAGMASCVGEAFAIQNVWGAILETLPRLEHREIAATRHADRMVEVAATYYVTNQTLDAFRARVAQEINRSEDAILARISDVGDVLLAMDRSEALHAADCDLFFDPMRRP